jgi:hypothetical protein
MTSLDKAHKLYLRHIYDSEKIKLLSDYNLKIAGSVPAVLWELFGALLTERSGMGLTGADLIGWEVKSAKIGSSFEYQYHLNTGAGKLKEDCEVNHIFCNYSETYKDVEVRVMRGKVLAQKYFKSWEPDYLKNYDTSVPDSQRRQRFRKSISFGYVESNGELVLKIKDGMITFRDDSVIPRYNKIDELWKHLEKQFKDGMTRQNQGEWHIDHIKPCSLFDLTDPEQQKECHNYKNLQPLWAIDNIKKSNKWQAPEALPSF